MEGERKRLSTPRLDRRNAMKNIDYQVEDDGAMNNMLNKRASVLGTIPKGSLFFFNSQQPEKDMNISENRDGGIKGVRPPVLAIVASDGDVGEKAFSDMVEEYSNSSMDDGSFRQIFGSWQKGHILGKGSFGTVYEGFTDDGIFFAVKEVSLLDDGSQGKQSIFQLQQEICLLSQFKHDNIVRYIGTDKDNDKLYIFLELVTKGSLASLYQKYHLKDSQVSVYTRQILSGLKYLHDRNVVHRDIKCANILVDANGSVKLADFGLAKATKLNDVKSSKGSPYWMAPEVVNLRNRGYGLAADIWSLGCTVLDVDPATSLFSLEGMQALFRIGRGQPPPVPESLSKDARDFILNIGSSGHIAFTAAF
ncbi:Serine/threonine-protein kinase, active site [Sesbania bispinosa]|nr:Serine/threonine-protein kinase, active site [Sesbania bispinosa]